METKGYYQPIEDKLVFADTSLKDQYKNLNLNQNHQCTFKESLSKQNDNKKVENYDLNNVSRPKKYSNSWNKSNKYLSTTFLNLYPDSEEKEEFKKPLNSNSSTLSLHIAAYENSVEATNDNLNDKSERETLKEKSKNPSLIKKWKTVKQFFSGSPLIIQGLFEFPRQEKNDSNKHPEVMHFKASQRLLNPNQLPQLPPSLGEKPPMADPLERLKEAIDAIGNINIVSKPRERVINLNLRVDKDGKLDGMGDYMHAKQNKLIHQIHSNITKKSEIFKGISFYIDGLTHPPSKDLQQLIIENGGAYHHYYRNGLTTYFVAEELASTKVDKVRKEQKIIKPTFITDSIKAGKILPPSNYYLLNNHGNHVNQFFDRSRLHLISTMAKELKKFVVEMKTNKATHKFTGREKLKHLKSTVNLNVPIICHIDMDCFFVSVALRNHPELIGRPIAITHSTAQDSAYGEIASCSYEAREKGCYARQFVRNALAICPNLQCLPYQFEEYVKIAKQLYSIVASYTLQIQAVSCDELYFDLASICQECQISDPLALITIIRHDILQQTKCIASAGLGPNALIARMATKKAKPNGQFYVTSEEVQEFIGDAPISNLPSVGWTTCEHIHQELGSDITLCKHLFKFSIDALRKLLGVANGEKVYQALRGKCEPLDFDNIVIDQKTISVNVNFGIRFKNHKDLRDTIKSIAMELSQRLGNISKIGSSLTLKLLIRLPNAPLEPAKYGAHGPCSPLRKTINVPPTCDGEIIYKASMQSLEALKPVTTDIRGVALHMSKLIPMGAAVTTKGPGTLWDFMKTKANEANAFEWVPKAPKPKITKKSSNRESDDNLYYSPAKEQDEMRMKISDVYKMMPYPESPPRPSRPTRSTRKIEDTSRSPSPWRKALPNQKLKAKSVYRQITRRKISVNGIEIYFNKPPQPQHFKQLFSNFKKYINAFETIRMEKMLEHFIRYVTGKAAAEAWKPLVGTLKRYLNWYSVNYFDHKVFVFEEGPNDDVEFTNFVNDIIREIFPKDRREPSPDLFEDHRESSPDIFEEPSVMIIPESDNDEDEVEVVEERIHVDPLSQESEECEILDERGPSTSKVGGNAAAKTTSKAPAPVAPLFKPLLPSRTTTTTTTAAGTSKQKPSTSKNSKAAKKPMFKKQTSFNFGEKRKQPALEDVWNIAAKKKRTSLPTRQMQPSNVDEECIIDDLDQSVIALN